MTSSSKEVSKNLIKKFRRTLRSFKPLCKSESQNILNSVWNTFGRILKCLKHGWNSFEEISKNLIKKFGRTLRSFEES